MPTRRTPCQQEKRPNSCIQQNGITITNRANSKKNDNFDCNYSDIQTVGAHVIGLHSLTGPSSKFKLSRSDNGPSAPTPLMTLKKQQIYLSSKIQCKENKNITSKAFSTSQFNHFELAMNHRKNQNQGQTRHKAFRLILDISWHSGSREEDEHVKSLQTDGQANRKQKIGDQKKLTLVQQS